MLIMQRHNYTIARVFQTLFIIYGNVVWWSINTEYGDIGACQATTAARYSKLCIKTHCRINGIKVGVVMNTNACTSIAIVSLSLVCPLLHWHSHSHSHWYSRVHSECCVTLNVHRWPYYTIPLHFVTFNKLFAILVVPLEWPKKPPNRPKMN